MPLSPESKVTPGACPADIASQLRKLETAESILSAFLVMLEIEAVLSDAELARLVDQLDTLENHARGAEYYLRRSRGGRFYPGYMSALIPVNKPKGRLVFRVEGPGGEPAWYQSAGSYWSRPWPFGVFKWFSHRYQRRVPVRPDGSFK